MKKTFRKYHLFNILSLYGEGLPLDVLLQQYFRKNRSIGSKDRKEISDTIYTLIRWLGLIDYHCSDSTGFKEWETDRCRWEERIHVLNTMNVKKSLHNFTIPTHIRVSFPKDLFCLLQKHYGEEKAISICLSSNTPAPITIRTNPLKTTRQVLYRILQEKFSVVPTKESIFGIHFKEKINFSALEEFKKGFFEVQDEASQLVANLVEAKPGDQILDYCAGSGGKTLAFAHRLQGKGQIYLYDVRQKILLKAKQRLKRAGIENAQIVLEDSLIKEKLVGKMDWVFVDVPCSGCGTLRRNPDLKWKFTFEMLERLVVEQRKIFEKALTYLSPQGKIVYVTCSILPQENEEQIDFFQRTYGLDLARRPFCSLPLPIEKNMAEKDKAEGGMDGFFGAVLKRVVN